MKTIAPYLTKIAIAMLLVSPAVGATAATPADPSRTICEAWAPPSATAGCGTVTITWSSPTCTGAGSTYQCAVSFEEQWTLLGAGCVFSDVDQYGSGYGGLCTTGHAVAQLGPVAVNYTGIPEDGLQVEVTATACFSADDGSDAPMPARSKCETWIVGAFELPAEE